MFPQGLTLHLLRAESLHSYCLKTNKLVNVFVGCAPLYLHNKKKTQTQRTLMLQGSKGP